MSPTAKVLLSLCLNVGLGVAYYFTRSGEVAPQVPSSAASVEVRANKQISAATMTITNFIPRDFKWEHLESTDYKEYIRNLRAVKCPEATIGDIILAELDNVYEPKLNPLRKLLAAAIQQRLGEPSGSSPTNTETETNKAKKALEAERAALVLELLGVTERSLRAAYNRHDDAVQNRYTFLSPEQRERLIAVEEKYDLFPGDGQQERLLFWRLPLPEEQVQEMRAELVQFLTPEQIREYDLRTSKTASSMRRDYRTIGVNEAEFRKAYDSYEAWDKARGELFDYKNPPTDERRAQLKRDEQKAIDQMKGVLTPERYAEFRLFRDSAYSDLYSAAPYLGFDPAAAKKVVDMRVEVNKAVDTVRNDQSLTEEVRQQKLLEIRMATEKAVIGAVGERGYNYYKRQGGRWMNAISPRILRGQP